MSKRNKKANRTTVVYTAKGKKQVPTSECHESRGPTVAGVRPDDRVPKK